MAAEQVESSPLREKSRESIESLQEKLDDIEKRIDDAILNSKKIAFWEKWKSVGPVASAIIVALIGLYATHSITGAIEKKRLELSHLTAMQELMVKLSSPDIERHEAEATGVVLGAFGSYAVLPLVNELGKGGVRSLAAREGLRVASFKDPDRTCELLIQVLEQQTGLFVWQTHREAIRLLGEIGCRDAAPILQEYHKLLGTGEGRRRYKQMVNLKQQLDDECMDIMRTDIELALKRIAGE